MVRKEGRKGGRDEKLGWGPGTKKILTDNVLFPHINGIRGKHEKNVVNSGGWTVLPYSLFLNLVYKLS